MGIRETEVRSLGELIESFSILSAKSRSSRMYAST
jgi:hypothetical protein